MCGSQSRRCQSFCPIKYEAVYRTIYACSLRTFVILEDAFSGRACGLEARTELGQTRISRAASWRPFLCLTLKSGTRLFLVLTQGQEILSKTASAARKIGPSSHNGVSEWCLHETIHDGLERLSRDEVSQALFYWMRMGSRLLDRGRRESPVLSLHV